MTEEEEAIEDSNQEEKEIEEKGKEENSTEEKAAPIEEETTDRLKKKKDLKENITRRKPFLEEEDLKEIPETNKLKTKKLKELIEEVKEINLETMIERTEDKHLEETREMRKILIEDPQDTEKTNKKDLKMTAT